jgi:hypothetical protein
MMAIIAITQSIVTEFRIRAPRLPALHTITTKRPLKSGGKLPSIQALEDTIRKQRIEISSL